MGSNKKLFDIVIRDIWEWVVSHNNWLSATHIPGVLNEEADAESRASDTRTEWRLNPDDFQHIVSILGFSPDIDIFASRINSQLPRFVSFRPDPEAEEIDAFTLDWSQFKFYAFPPFILVGRVIQKIIMDKATGIVVAPDWPNQPWYHSFSQLVVRECFLYPRDDLLYLPNDEDTVHPLHQSLRLRAALLSSGTSL